MQNHEKELINELRAEPNAGFKALYIMHFKMVEHFVVNNSGSSADASDLFQDAMVVLYKKVSDTDFKLTSTLKTYLYSICRNLWLNKLRKKGNTVELTDFEKVTDVVDGIAEKKVKEKQLNKIELALSQLGEPCASIIKMFYYQKSSIQQIADKFDYKNLASAKNQKYKCLQRLKALAYA